MAVNLASRVLGTHIRCDKPSCDGHDIENLIATADSPASCPRRPGGYLAAPFVKPPVNVTLTFPCPVDICRIDVGTRLRQHGASTVELLTHSPSRWPPLSASDGVAAHTSDAELFKPVGWYATEPRGRTAAPEGPIAPAAVPTSLVCFENRTYRPRRALGFSPPPPQLPEGAARAALRTSVGLAHLSRVLRLIVRIVYVSGGRIPALSCLRVWGQPAAVPAGDAAASAAYRAASDRLLAAAAAATAAVSVPQSMPCVLSAPVPKPSRFSMTVPPSGTQAMGSERKRKLSDQPVDGHRSAPHLPAAVDGRSAGDDSDLRAVPIEFVDPITCEIMSLPVLLPSGNTVDQTTLERFADAEAAFGRPPSDPFTGVPLQTGVPPVPNVGLKVRIDQFLIEQGDWLASVARTVGTGRQAYERGSRSTRPELCRGCSNSGAECSSSGSCCPDARKPSGPGNGGISFTAASPTTAYTATPDTEATSATFAACQANVMPSAAATGDSNADCRRRVVGEVLWPAASSDDGRATVVRASLTAADREVDGDSGGPNDDLAKRDEMPSRSRHESRLAFSLEQSLQFVLGRLPSATSPGDRIRAGNGGTDAVACCHLDRSSATLSLSCGHSMCILCARSSLKRDVSRGSQLVCPTCGSQSTASSGQIMHGPGRASAAGLPGV